MSLAERNAFIAELHAKGQPVWWDEVVDKSLAEQAEDSGAGLFREGLAAIDLAAKQFAPSLSTRDESSSAEAALRATRPSGRDELKPCDCAPSVALLEKAVERARNCDTEPPRHRGARMATADGRAIAQSGAQCESA